MLEAGKFRLSNHDTHLVMSATDDDLVGFVTAVKEVFPQAKSYFQPMFDPSSPLGLSMTLMFSVPTWKGKRQMRYYRMVKAGKLSR